MIWTCIDMIGIFMHSSPFLLSKESTRRSTSSSSTWLHTITTTTCHKLCRKASHLNKHFPFQQIRFAANVKNITSWNIYVKLLPWALRSSWAVRALKHNKFTVSKIGMLMNGKQQHCNIHKLSVLHAEAFSCWNLTAFAFYIQLSCEMKISSKPAASFINYATASTNTHTKARFNGSQIVF